MSFAHLHVHSEFSLLDGAIRIDDLVERAAEIGQTAVAITDHGCVFGAVKFSNAAKEKDIKPIIGSEVYVATTHDMTEAAKNPGDNYHLTLLAKNRRGYLNLARLSSLAHLQGLSYKPRIDLPNLATYSEGLIVLSGCIGAQLPQLLIRGQEKEAQELVSWYQMVFGDDFFIELMSHGATGGVDHVRVEEDGQILMQESELNAALVDIANKNGAGIVATNDAHYLKCEHGDTHDSLLCLGMGAWKSKEGRMRFPGAEHEDYQFYIKSETEMLDVCDEDWWTTACANTAILADRVEGDVIPMGQQILPDYRIPEDDVGFRVWKATGELI